MAAETVLTIGEAADALGVSGSFVSNLIKRGKLPSVYRFGRKLVPRAAVLRRKRQQEAGKISKGGTARREWTATELALLGKMRDGDVAVKVGVSKLTVFKQRNRLKIKPFSHSTKPFSRSTKKKARKTAAGKTP